MCVHVCFYRRVRNCGTRRSSGGRIRWYRSNTTYRRTSECWCEHYTGNPSTTDDSARRKRASPTASKLRPSGTRLQSGDRGRFCFDADVTAVGNFLIIIFRSAQRHFCCIRNTRRRRYTNRTWWARWGLFVVLQEKSSGQTTTWRQNAGDSLNYLLELFVLKATEASKRITTFTFISPKPQLVALLRCVRYKFV